MTAREAESTTFEELPLPGCTTLLAGYCCGCYFVVPLALYAGAPIWFATFAPATIPIYFLTVWWLVGNPELPVDVTRLLMQLAGWLALVVAGVGGARLIVLRRFRLWPVVAFVAGQILIGVTLVKH